MASLSKIQIPDSFPKPSEFFSLKQNLENQLRSYKLSIYTNNFNDDDHENFITNNIDAFKELDLPFITNVFFAVVNKGHLKTLKVLLQNECIDIDVQDEFHATALMIASKLGYFEIVNYLLQQKANKGIQREQGYTALMIATISGRKRIVSVLCENGAKIDTQNDNKDTALMLAAKEGHRDIVLALIKNKANKDLQNENGDTALIIAAKEGYKNIVLALIQSGANKDLLNKKGQTALTCLSITKKTTEVVDLLFREKAMEIPADDLDNILSNISAYANTLIKKLSKLPKAQSHNSSALVLLPLSDSSGAFTIHQRLYIIRTLAKYYNVKIKHPTSAEQIKRFLKKREYKVLFISGHGSAEDIVLSENFSLTRENIQIFASTKPSLNASIVLDSCSTGKNGGIAEVIANIAKMKTFAPEEDVDGFTMELGDDEFQIDFSREARKVQTRVIYPSRIKKRKRSSSF
ncbi:MAG: hypothetical protein K1060chlam1_01234 [Candidatus Anoxychlamydiales bacterium]|nr:hypothetical protein [Candidatus Anoxychlamydiales bacterium]